MQQVKLMSHVGDDGILRLEILTEVKEMDVEVTVTFEPVKTETLSEARERLAKVRQKLSHSQSKRIFEEIQQGYEGQIFSDSTELLREDRQR